MAPGPYLFLPNDRRYDPLYAMVDRYSTIQFFDRYGGSPSCSVRIPVKIASQYGQFVELRASVCLDDLIRPRMRHKAASAPISHIPTSIFHPATDASYPPPGAGKGSGSAKPRAGLPGSNGAGATRNGRSVLVNGSGGVVRAGKSFFRKSTDPEHS